MNATVKNLDGSDHDVDDGLDEDLDDDGEESGGLLAPINGDLMGLRTEDRGHVYEQISLIGWQRDDEDLAFPEWAQVGTRLRTIEAGIQWTIGDWVNYGRNVFGNDARHTIDGFRFRGLDDAGASPDPDLRPRVESYSAKSIDNMARVAELFDPEERDPRIVWTFYRIASGLGQKRDRQRAIKKVADRVDTDEPLTTREFQDLVDEMRGKTKDDKDLEATDQGLRTKFSVWTNADKVDRDALTPIMDETAAFLRRKLEAAGFSDLEVKVG